MACTTAANQHQPLLLLLCAIHPPGLALAPGTQHARRGPGAGGGGGGAKAKGEGRLRVFPSTPQICKPFSIVTDPQAEPLLAAGARYHLTISVQ
jgi:hypothetical protein